MSELDRRTLLRSATAGGVLLAFGGTKVFDRLGTPRSSCS